VAMEVLRLAWQQLEHLATSDVTQPGER